MKQLTDSQSLGKEFSTTEGITYALITTADVDSDPSVCLSSKW